MSSYTPLSKPLKIVWLAGVLCVAGLTLWHIPAWWSLCHTPGSASGRIVATHLDHGFVRYRFQAGDRAWEGTAAHHWHGGPWLELGDAVEVFYAPSDPPTNQLGQPSPGDWWRHAVGYLLCYSVFPVTIVVGIVHRLLQSWSERTLYD